MPPSRLARLQQFLTLGTLLGAGLWTAGWWPHAPVLALGGLLIVTVGHAGVLGFEFMLLARVNRGDPAPAATRAQLWAAWAGESLHAPLVFCWRQPFRSRRWPDFLPRDAQGRRGVVLVHGFVCNRGLWNRWYPRLQVLSIPHIGVDLEPVFGSIDDYAACIDDAVRRLWATTGTAPVVVAHSMGGLAVRAWWSKQPADAIHHLITIGTPHRGTWLARFGTTLNARQMRVDGSWLVSLTTQEDRRRAHQVTCFYSHCDNVVFPASTATLPEADNRHLPAVAHVHMVDHPAPFAKLVRLAADGARTSTRRELPLAREHDAGLDRR